MSVEAAALFVSLSAKTDAFTKQMSSAESRMKSFTNSSGKSTKQVSENFGTQEKAVSRFAGTSVSSHGKAARAAEEGSSRTVRANEKSRGSFTSLAGSVLGMVGAYQAYAAAKGAVQFTSELTLNTSKLTAVTGMSAKQASTWINVLGTVGVSTNNANMGFITLGRQMIAAGENSKKPVAAFKDLGISMKDLKDMKMQDVILAIADGFKKMGPGAQRSADAQLLLSRNAKALLPIMSQGKDAVLALFDEAQKYGAYIGGDMGKKLKAWHDQQIVMKLAVDGLKISFAENLMPILVKVGAAFLTFVGQMREGKGAGGELASALSTSFGIIKGAVMGVVNLAGGLGNFVKILAGMAAAFTAMKVISAVSGAISLLSTAIANPELTVAFLAIAGAAYLIQKNWSTVGPFFKQVWTDIKVMFIDPVVNSLTAAWNTIYTSLKGAWTQISAIFAGGIGGTGKGINWLAILGDVAGAVSWVITAWSKLFAWEVGALTKVAQAIGAAIKWMIGAWQAAVSFMKPIIESIVSTFSPVINSIVHGFKSLAPVIGPALNVVGDIFKRIFGAMKTVVSPVIAIIGDIAHIASVVLVGAFKTAWNMLKPIMKGIADVISGAFQIIKGLIQVFTGVFTLNFSTMWKGIKNIFSGAVKALVGIITGIWGAMKAAASGIIHAIGDGISAAWNSVIKIMDHFLNLLMTPVNLVLGVIGVKQIHFAEGGVAGKGVTGGDYAALTIPGHATGGVVNRPGYFAGEEAPSHPEVILATNPKYRQRNLGLFAQAGNMLGVPGYATGGIHSNSDANAYLQKKVGSNDIGSGIAGVVNSLTAAAANKLIDAVPLPSLPGFLNKIPPFLVKGIKELIGSNSAKLNAAAGGGSGVTGGDYGALTYGKTGKGGLGTFGGVEVASWIIPVLNWARGHGWGGSITSGYRPGSAGNHSGTAYPSGAVDVGWNTSIAEGTALENVVKNYPGSEKLLWGGTYISGYTDPRGITAPGGHDYGHFSGTGRAKGGIEGASEKLGYAQGGVNGNASLIKRATNYAHGVWGDLNRQHAIPKGHTFPHLAFPAHSPFPKKEFSGLEAMYASWYPENEVGLPLPMLPLLFDAKGPYYAYERKSLVHEMAHTMQSPMTQSKQWTREGGASAWASEHSPYHVDDTTYDAFKARVWKEKGRQWVNKGQFGLAKGGIPKGYALGGIWNVPASAESDGDIGKSGYRGPVKPAGWSELSIVGDAHQGAAGAGKSLGSLPYQFPLAIRKHGAENFVTAFKNDIGSGSDGNHPVIGLYRDTRSALGIGYTSSSVDIAREDGGALHPPRGTFMGAGSGKDYKTRTGKTYTGPTDAQKKAAIKRKNMLEVIRLAGKRKKYLNPFKNAIKKSEKAGATEPAIFRALKGTRNMQRDLMDKFADLDLTDAADLPYLDTATGDWMVGTRSVPDQIKVMQGQIDTYLTPARNLLGTERGQAGEALKVAREKQKIMAGYVKQLKDDITKTIQKIKDQWDYITREQALADKHKKQLEKELARYNEEVAFGDKKMGEGKELTKGQKERRTEAKNRIPGIEAEIKDMNSDNPTPKNQHLANIIKTKWKIADLTKSLGAKDSVLPTDLYGALSIAKTNEAVFANTGTSISQSGYLFPNDRKVSTKDTDPAPMVAFNSIPDRMRTVTDTIDSVHREMAAATASLVVDTSGDPTSGTAGDGTSGGGDTGTTATATVVNPMDAIIAQQLLASQALNRTYAATSDVLKNVTGASSNWQPFLGSFAEGIMNVPMDGLAAIHKGEAVLPASINPYGQSGSHTSGQVDVHLHGDAQRFHNDVEIVVNGKTQSIIDKANHQLGRTVGLARQTPASPGRLARY